MYDDYVDHSKGDGKNSISYVSCYRMVVANNISFARLGYEECEVCESHFLHLHQVGYLRVTEAMINLKVEKLYHIQSCDLCKQWLQH